MATQKQDAKYAQDTEHMLTAGVFSPAEVKYIREYLGEMKAISARTFGNGRANNVVAALYAFRKGSGNMATIDTTGIYSAMAALKEYRQPKNGRLYAPNTLNAYQKTAKGFLMWLNEKGYNQKYNDKSVRKIKCVKVSKVNHEPGDILTNEEVSALIRACRCDRDRALISVMYHSAGRVNEVLSAKWQDLRADIRAGSMIGYYFTLHGTKTASTKDATKPRELYLPRATAELLNIHKNGMQPAEGDHIFTDVYRNERIEPDACRKICMRLAAAAGIKKNVHPHIFRTSRITNWVKEGQRETDICMAAWGTPTSMMWNTYVILAGGHAAENMKGLINADIPAEVAPVAYKAPAKCMKCGNVPPEHALFCPVCGKNLKETAPVEAVKETADAPVTRAEFNDLMAKYMELAKKNGI